jgi:hypothetical protein
VVSAPIGHPTRRTDVAALQATLAQYQPLLSAYQQVLDQARMEGDFDAVATFTRAITTVKLTFKTQKG